MKRLRSSDDLDYGEKIVAKDTTSNPSRSSSSHRSFYYKSENARKGLSNSSSTSSFRYDRDRSVGDDDSRENPRPVRKRSEHVFDSFDRRKGFDRYRDGYGGDRSMMHRSESFAGPRRDFPKGFRSERDRSRREGSVSSWRRFGLKEFEESGRGNTGSGRGEFGITKNSNLNSPKNTLRDVKSPSWSKDSNSEQSRVKSSPSRGLGDGKSVSKSRSPTWSKDSESEQSKSVEVKKTEEQVVESGSSSEMEEGELEPEPETKHECGAELCPEAGAESEAKQDTGLDSEVKDVENVNAVMECEKEAKASKESVSERTDVGEKVEELPNYQNDSADEVECAVKDKAGKEEGSRECNEEVNKDVVDGKSLNLERDCKDKKGTELEVKVENVEFLEANKEVEEENGAAEVGSSYPVEGLTQNFKDKGKRVAVTLTHAADSVQDNVWIERESKEVVTSRDNEMEGPSTRGFELFSTSPVRKREKNDQTGADSQKDEKLGMESLDLSLSLPNVLLPIGAHDSTAATPGSPSHGRSVQSFSTFRTSSDGFTASMSFSGSQSFYHNPSCSLTQNSMDNYEQSVGSRPIFQGIDQGTWQGQSQNESKHKEVPLYQKILMNGNGSLHQPQALMGVSNGQAVQGQHLRVVVEGSSKLPNGLERQLSFQKQLSGGHPRHHDDVRSPSQSVGSHEIGSNYSFDKKRVMREKHGGNLYRSSSMKEQEQLMIGGADFVGSIITRIVSEPIHVMARKFHEMTGQSLACVKESIREIMLNADKHGQLSVFQKVLQNRSDLTLEMLLKSHRAQLEILVALKTGLQDFLQQENNVAPSDLAEIFLNLRCRNLTCRSVLPVDECDCKVCAQKNGFCSACMCLVCSKFDMASNTCSWVGCDVCLHWCHADCGLRESYIRNGRSATGSQGTTEMQFQCVACDHPSEMFGFVKEVFQNFAKEWTAETLSRELEYVKRIFSASKDLRGKRLHEIADQMLARLSNKANLPEVYNYIMGFMAESDSSKFGNTPVFSGKEHGKGSNGIDGDNEGTKWFKSVYSEKTPILERTASLHNDRNDKLPMKSELRRTAPKEPLFDELESIVRIKQAEAKMFQTRADDARREAEGLKCIAIAKNEKIEEEYTSRITKLRLVEAEEMRKQKFEELQSLERAHREYFNMKMRMEADIKDLLLKMESTKRNIAM